MEENKTVEFIDVDNLTKDELWSNIGFHRPIAGFFYNLPLTLLSMILGIAVIGWLTQFLYPFPEALGYKALATGLFGLYIEAFNLGTANMMNRFIGEANVKDPQSMIHYIQYFIWYQMITGLIQTTLISMYALFIVPESQLGYTVWIMLIFSTTEYPGMLGIFGGVLGTLQQYNKTAILGFISGQVFQRITEIAFVLLGRYYGIMNPEIGEIMGIAIGASIGFYVDDFIATLMSAWFFQQAMKSYNIRVRDCFRHDFDSKLFKTCLSWGIRSGLPSMLWGVVTYVELLLWIRYAPQYATFKALFDIAGGFSGLINWNIDLGGSISESFFNDKKELANYYVGQAFRYTGLFQWVMISVILIVSSVLEPMFVLLNIEYQIMAIPFIFPRVVRDLQQSYNNIAMNVVSSTGHVNYQALTNVVETVLSLLAWIIFIPVLQLPDKYGVTAVMWLLPCAELPGILTKIAMQYIFIQKKVLKLKIPWFQFFVAPVLSSMVYLGVGFLYLNFIFFPMNKAFGTIVAIIPAALILILGGLMFLYFPLTVYFGGWDDGSLGVLEKATHISGMGKMFIVPLYRLLFWVSKRSKLHNRFAVDDALATQQVKELMIIKNENSSVKIRIAK